MTDPFAFATEYVQTVPVPIAKHVFFVAEIGINHNGDLDIAKKLIDMSKAAGCDAVKFQKRTLDLVYSKQVLDSPRESPWGTTTRAQKERLEFSEAQYDEIDAYCRKIGIDWFASAWDVPSQKFLGKYRLKYNKIGSPLLTHRALLETVAQERKPTFVSTGMSTFAQIDDAVRILSKHRCPFVLMHSVSEYPTQNDRLNLYSIVTLRERYHCPVGYSGHESTMSPGIYAALMGAVAIERHVTLDRAMYGTDQAASLEKRGLELLVAYVRAIPETIGDGVKRVSEGEIKNAKKLRYWEPQ